MEGEREREKRSKSESLCFFRSLFLFSLWSATGSPRTIKGQKEVLKKRSKKRCEKVATKELATRRQKKQFNERGRGESGGRDGAKKTLPSLSLFFTISGLPTWRSLSSIFVWKTGSTASTETPVPDCVLLSLLF